MAVTFALLLGTTVMASPASAKQYGTVCRNAATASGNIVGRWCVTVNTGDIGGGFKTEALSFTEPIHLNAQWRWDWVHLYRNGVYRTGVGPTGWMSGGNTSFSTGWTFCASAPTDWHTSARFQMKSNNGTNTAWMTMRSDVYTATFC